MRKKILKLTMAVLSPFEAAKQAWSLNSELSSLCTGINNGYILPAVSGSPQQGRNNNG